MKLTKEEFEDRGDQFWEEIQGIVDMLNKTSPKFKITDHRDATVTQYLLWRVLTEGKVANQKGPQYDTRFLNELRILFESI